MGTETTKTTPFLSVKELVKLLSVGDDEIDKLLVGHVLAFQDVKTRAGL